LEQGTASIEDAAVRKKNKIKEFVCFSSSIGADLGRAAAQVAAAVAAWAAAPVVKGAGVAVEPSLAQALAATVFVPNAARKSHIQPGSAVLIRFARTAGLR
jgi:hypothetical protein